MTTSWPPGVSALDVSELFHVGETPNKSSFYVLCIMYINQIKNIIKISSITNVSNCILRL